MIKTIPFKMMITVKQYAEMCGISVSTARRHLDKLVKEGTVIVNKQQRPYTYQRKSYEIIKHKDGLQRIKALRDLVIGKVEIKEGTIGGIIENVEFDHNSDIWIDYLSTVKNSKLRGPTYISKSTISNSTISESNIKLCAIDQSFIQRSYLFSCQVKFSEIASSCVEKSNVTDCYTINNSRLQSSTLENCYYVDYSTIDQSYLVNSSFNHTNVINCKFKGLRIFDSYIQKSLITINEQEVRNCSFTKVKISCKYPVPIKNLELHDTTKNLSIKDLIFSEFGLLPDQEGNYTLYKKVTKQSGKFVSILDNDFEYKIGEYAEVEDYDSDVTNACSRGIHATSLNNISKFSGSIILELKINIKDIITISELKIRCKKVFVVRELKDFIGRI